MTTREILIAARKRIEKPEAWHKGAYAKSKDGKDIWGRGLDACAWCAAGAVFAEVGYIESEPRDALCRAIFGNSIGQIGSWNDAPERTHAEVLAAFDRAIAATPEPAHDA